MQGERTIAAAARACFGLDASDSIAIGVVMLSQEFVQVHGCFADARHRDAARLRLSALLRPDRLAICGADIGGGRSALKY